MNPYQPLFDEALKDPDCHHWSQFYRRARSYARYLAAEHRLPYERVCDVVAVLSPMKSWPENLRLAHRACEIVAKVWPKDDLFLPVDFKDLPVMRERRVAVARAFNGDGVSGPKVSAFAANIRGDLTQVTVDRHMLNAAGFEADNSTKHARERCVAWVHDIEQPDRVYNPTDYYPAEVQAIIWAYWRKKKGLK